MAEEEHYTIGELARLAGVTPRTIRYYTVEGLLPPPEARGRYARYGPEHLRRLQRIAELKASYLPLSVIRGRLEQEAAGRGRAADTTPSPGGQPGPELPQPPRRGRIAESGAAYMQAGVTSGAEPFRLTPAPLQKGRVDFFPTDEEPLGGDEEAGPPSRWQRVSLARDVELWVREPISPRRRAQLDELIAAARDCLAAEE